MMDEVRHSDSHLPSSPVMESPLMQLANASIMRGSLSPKRDIKNAEVESKSNPFSSASLHSASSKANMDLNISISSNSNIDTMAQTQVPLESTVSIMSDPSPDKLIKSSFAFVGTTNPILENVTAPHLPKRENVANVAILKTESHSHKEHTKYSVPHDDHIFAKSSVSRVLTSNPSETISATAVAAGNAISKMRVDPKSFVSCPTSSQFPTRPRLDISPSQIKATNLQGGNSSSKPLSTVKMIPCENAVNVSFTPSESTLKTNQTAVQQCMQSVSLTQRDTKASANHNPNPNPLPFCSVTQESQNDANDRPQMKYLSNTKVTSLSNTCSLPTKTPSVLLASSTTASVTLHSSPLSQLHTVTQSSKNHCLLNKPSHVRKSQNISENLPTTKEPSFCRTSVNVSTTSQASSVTRNPSFSRISFPVKSADYISPHTSAVESGTNLKELNSSSTSYSSANLVSHTSGLISKQLTSIGEKNDALYSSPRKAIPAKINVEIPSKLFSPVISPKEINTTFPKSSLTKRSNTDLACRDSAVLCTPTMNTTISAVVPTTKFSSNRLTSTISTTSIPCTATLSTSTTAGKLCTLSVSAHAPVIPPKIVTDSQTVAMLTPSYLSSSALSDVSYSSSLTTAVATTTITTYCSISCASSSLPYTPSSATTSTSAVSACIPSATVQSPKKLILLRESIANKCCVNNSKNVARCPRSQDGNLPIIAMKDHTSTTNFIGRQLSYVQSNVIQKQQSSIFAMPPHLKIAAAADDETKDKLQAASFSDAYSHVSETTASFTVTKTEICPPTAKTVTCSPAAKTETCSPAAKTETCPPAAKTETCPPAAKTETCPPAAKTETCPPVAKTETCPPVAKTEACPPVAKTEACPPVAKTEACPPAAKTGACPPAAKTETCPPAAKTGACPPAAKTGACPPAAKTETCPPAAKTGACPPAAKTGACPPAAKTGACPPAAKTGACPPAAKTGACPPAAQTGACPPVAKTETCPPVAKTETCPSAAQTETCPPAAQTETCPPAAQTAPCPPAAQTETCPPAAKTAPCPPAAKTAPCPPAAKTAPCPPAAKTAPCPPAAKTAPCPPAAKTAPCPPAAKTAPCPPAAKTAPCPPAAKTAPCPPAAKTAPCPPAAKTAPCPPAAKTAPCPPAAKIEPCPSAAKIEPCPPTAETSMITESKACSTIAAIKSQSATTKSETLSSEGKFPVQKLLKNSLSKTVTKKSSKIKKIDSISTTTPHSMTKNFLSERNKQFSDPKSTISVATFEPVNDDTKKKLVKSKNTSKVSSCSVSPVAELGPSPTKKSKLLKKDSKSDTVCKKRVLSHSTSVRSKKEDKKTVSSDDTCAKSTSPLKDNPKMSSDKKDELSSDKKDESLLPLIKTETDVTAKEGNSLNKTDECNISTRPRRTIKARHLFSSSPYSTGEVKSETTRESPSSKQRKRINPPSTAEEKKVKSNLATKKSHASKTADEGTDSPLKKPVHRRILPAIKTDSKKCVLIKEASPNAAHVPSDSSIPTGCTYLLTPVSLTNAETNCVKTMKTPTMASNSGVTSTSPTYSNSKRNVTTKCSSTKEQQSTKTNKACTNSLVSSLSMSVSHKTGKISPVNDTSKESLINANESDTLQNSIKMSSSTCVTSNSLSSRSSDDFSKQIAEAETFIKKEPLEIAEIDENNALAISQNSSAECAPIRETPAINNFLNTDCSNTQVSIVQDFISPTSGNNVSQTRPLAPVQLGSPYAIFLPVSLASGAPTTTTTPSSSAPLYNIQLNVPNVVRMGKPIVPNDGGITKKHCTIIPTIASKTDNSSVKSSLISRNNLLATYYPAPLPESLMNKITVDYHACEECGDTFLFKSSLNSHKSRKCMQLTYNCDNCTLKLIFYNKCSVLQHIRSHYPNRPVTIKLEKMEVAPLPESITDVLETEVECKEESSPINSEETAANFDCMECGSKFQSARALADHFGHSQLVCSFTFYCALCQTYLPRRCSHLAHQRVHLEKPPHVCPECGQLISNIFAFREHLKYKCMHFFRVASLTCPKCTSKFSYTPELKEHIISVHSETFIKCSICPMAFKAFPSYQTHHQNTHASEAEQNKEIYKCPLCDTVFHTTQQLTNHVEIHIVELKKGINYAFRCSMCTSVFAKRSQLVSHLGSSHHLDYLQHKCEFCDCICKTAHNLQTHQKAIHKIDVKKVDGSNCSTIKSESATVKAKKKKSKDVTHCSFCHIFFATQAQLQIHTTKVHQKKTNDSPPDVGTEESASSAQVTKNKSPQKVCQYCKAPYKSWSRLMQHILGHRKSGVYICLICTSAAFVDENEFIKHEELCGGEKNPHDKPSTVYECDECHQFFNQESWLIAHQKNIHPKKDALACDACGLHYKTNSSLQKHMQTVHEGKPIFCCYYCKELNVEKSFRCQNMLEKHLLAKHSTSLNAMKIKQSDDEEEENQTSPTSEKTNCKNSRPARKSLDVVPAKKAKRSPIKEETYICAKCNFTSKKFKIFQLHIQEHDAPEDEMQCSICKLCFAAVDSLRMHLFAVHKIKSSNDTNLQDNKVNISPVPKETDDNSPSPVRQSPAPNTSVENSESTSTVPVKSVSKETKLVKPTTSDTNSETNLITCECNVCFKKFETEHQLKVHMRTHGMAFIRSKYLTTSDLSNS